MLSLSTQSMLPSMHFQCANKRLPALCSAIYRSDREPTIARNGRPKRPQTDRTLCVLNLWTINSQCEPRRLHKSKSKRLSVLCYHCYGLMRVYRLYRLCTLYHTIHAIQTIAVKLCSNWSHSPLSTTRLTRIGSHFGAYWSSRPINGQSIGDDISGQMARRADTQTTVNTFRLKYRFCEPTTLFTHNVTHNTTLHNTPVCITHSQHMLQCEGSSDANKQSN